MNFKKKKLFCYSNDKHVAVTYALSKEEAIYTFERQFKDVIGSDVKEVEYNVYKIGEIK